MNWITLLLQLFALRKTAQESSNLVNAAKNIAERGKRTAISFSVLGLAFLLFYSALMVAVIDIGLQLDRAGSVSYSGLMISATILFVLGLVLLATGLFVGRVAHAPAERAPPRTGEREDRIKDLLETFLVNFLSRMVSKGNPGEPKRDAGRPKQD